MPVSRGRKAKKSKKRPQRTVVVRRAEPDAVFSQVSGNTLGELADVLESLLGQGDVPEWWGQSQERLIDASRGLLAATSPGALEQAAAELIGGSCTPR